jgi:hypothetical protein
MTYFDRIFEKVRSLQREVDSVYLAARKTGEPHAVILEQLTQRVHSRVEAEKLPRWAVSEVHGYTSAWFNRLYQDHLIWAHEMPEGWIDSHGSGQAEFMTGRYDQIKRSAHLWKEHFQEGKIRIFSSRL